MHEGRCNKPLGFLNNQNKNEKDTMTLTKKQLFQLMATQRNDANSNGLPHKPGGWKNGLTKAEQMFVIWDNHGVNGFDSDTEISPDQVKASRKRARMAMQRMKKL